MQKRFAAVILALILIFQIPIVAAAAQNTQNSSETTVVEPPKVITDFSEPRKILLDPNFNLSGVEQDVLEAWYSQTVVIPDATLRKAIKSAAGVPSDSDVSVADMLGLIGTLDLSGLGISSLVGLEYAINVNRLILSNNKLTSLESLSNLYKLENLDYSNNQIKVVPGWIFASDSLVYVNGNNNNTTLVSASDQDSVLEELYLEGNNLTALPDLWCLKKIQVLSIANNNFVEFPETVLSMTTLKSFSIAKNDIEKVPDMSKLVALKTLDMSNNSIIAFPDGIYNMPSLKQLNLSGNRITSVPDSIANVPISVLNLSQNELSDMPGVLAQLNELTVLDIGVNYIDLASETNAPIVTQLTGKLETFHYKIQIPQFTFTMNEFEDKPSGKLIWAGINDISDESEGSLVITKFVLERIEETINPDENKETSGDTNDEQTDESDENSTETEGDGTKPTLNIYKEIAVLDSTVREYIDETASPGKNYTYRLTAYATCNYLGETSFEIEIVKKVNTVEMIMDTLSKEEIIRYAVIGAIVLILIGVAIYVLMKNSKKKKRRKRSKIKKLPKKATAAEANTGEKKARQPVKRKDPTRSELEKLVDKENSKPKYNERLFDDEYSTSKAYLEEKIDKYLKDEFPEDWHEK